MTRVPDTVKRRDSLPDRHADRLRQHPATGPLDGVKLELAVLLVTGALIAIVLFTRFDAARAVFVLAAYGSAVATWTAWRTRRAVRRWRERDAPAMAARTPESS